MAVTAHPIKLSSAQRRDLCIRTLAYGATRFDNLLARVFVGTDLVRVDCHLLEFFKFRKFYDNFTFDPIPGSVFGSK